jgi:uncharacterized membrane protein
VKLDRLVGKIIATAVLAICACAAVVVQGAELISDTSGPYDATIERVVTEEVRPLGWKDGESTYRLIEARLLEGPQKGEVVFVETDFPGIEEGRRVALNHIQDGSGTQRYAVVSLDRTMRVYGVVLLFAFAVIVFGGWQGVRSLLALVGSFLAIFYVLIPGLLAGWHPFLSSFLVAAGVLFVAIFITHGFTRESAVAYIGTMFSISLTGLIALYAVDATYLTGYSGDETTYLDINTAGTLDFRGLLLGAIVIGILGVLDDVAVTQAAVVSELFAGSKTMTRAEAYRRAMRVGREHVGALVNTLVLAYAGTALPLMLLFTVYGRSLDTALNMEIFATEVVRAAVGSIGLILTVPIVTGLAVAYLKGKGTMGGGHAHCHGHGHSHEHK